MSLDAFYSPDSSIIAGATYDSDSRQMVVTIKRGRDMTVSYTYTGIPADVWEQFDAAPSKGGFFNSHIRPLYSGKQGASSAV